MSKRLRLIFLFLLSIAFVLGSCEKLEIPEIGEDNKESSEDTNTDNDTDDSTITDEYDEEDPYQGWGSLENQIENGGTLSRPFRAKDLAHGELGEWVVSYNVTSLPNCWVEGYIVGYVKGSSMSSAQLFQTADRESNILIASDTANIDATDCVPIGLSTGSSYQSTRDALNLKSNKNLMKRKVKILGSVSKYMGVAGLRKARNYKFID